MIFKKYQLPLLIISLASISTLTLILTRMSPCIQYGSSTICTQSSISSLIFFYISLLISLSSIFALITFTIRNKFSLPEKINHNFNTSLRQGILFSAFTTLSLSFLSLGILKWWTSIILLTMIILIEFLSLQKRT